MLSLEKGHIGKMEVKNRIFMGPMGYGLDGYGPQALAYFEDRCKGGAGLIFTHYTVAAGADSYLSTNPADHENIKKMAKMAHSYGAKACMQLFLGYGRVMRFLFGSAYPKDAPTFSASAVPELGFEDRLCVPYTTEEIKAQLENVKKAAEFIGKESGYDCIEIHGYGGYLGDCFLTERWNNRTDEYGGKDIKSRAKYLLDIIAAVREAVGPDFPIFVKFTY